MNITDLETERIDMLFLPFTDARNHRAERNRSDVIARMALMRVFRVFLVSLGYGK